MNTDRMAPAAGPDVVRVGRVRFAMARPGRILGAAATWSRVEQLLCH